MKIKKIIYVLLLVGIMPGLTLSMERDFEDYDLYDFPSCACCNRVNWKKRLFQARREGSAYITMKCKYDSCPASQRSPQPQNNDTHPSKKSTTQEKE